MAANFEGKRAKQFESEEGRITGAAAGEFPCGKGCDCAHGMTFFEWLTLCGVSLRTNSGRVRFSPGIHGLICLLGAAQVLAMAGSGASAQAQVPDASPARTTVVVFADQPMQEAQWSELFAALRAGLAFGGAETEPLDDEAEFVRGDSAPSGFRVQSAIVVYLHGDCNLAPLPRRTAYGVPLGWVRRVDGRIEPFAHVDCTRIGQVIGVQALRMGTVRRNTVMAGAIARVIVHEWIHIAAQSSSHTERGIEKAQYGVTDLMAGEKWQNVMQIPSSSSN
jgi:hypothetical protein